MDTSRRDTLRLLVGTFAVGAGLTLAIEPAEAALPVAEGALKFRLMRGDRVLQTGDLPPEVVRAIQSGEVDLHLAYGPWGQPGRVALRQALPVERLRGTP